MNSTAKTFLLLLGATVFFNLMFYYLSSNIEDFENLPLPPKKVDRYETNNPLIKVDAQSRDTWALLDFSTGKIHRVEDMEKDTHRLQKLDWDLAFQRTKIVTNGGVTNPQGPVQVKNLGQVEFDQVQDVPAARTDFKQDDRGWGGSIVNQALVDWYIYRTRTHNVESKKDVFLIDTGDGFVKMKIINYYCERPESDCKSMMCTRDEAACLTLEYRYVPEGENIFPTNPIDQPQTAQVSH
ncbi:HmuY family protein [Nitrospina sp. 32_T5]|uniref:HmuY family protein n=1 Tax=unclassified Nitrospina TaxID=2638683 RepID=UPI003F97850C